MNTLIDSTRNTLQCRFTHELYNRFISYVDVSGSSINTYARSIRQFANYITENDIIQPAREDILNYRELLKQTCKPSTVQNYITAIRLFFKWTEQEGYYPNIADNIKGANINKDHKKDYLTSDQIQSILSIIDKSDVKGLRDYAIIALMVTGGLRTIEVSRANIEDMRTLGDTMVLYLQGKGRDERTEYIKIVPEVEQAIRKYLKHRNSTDIKTSLFTSTSNNNSGQRLTTRSISGIVKDRLINAGFNSERLTAHSLRHTAVTLSLIGGNSLQDVQQFARHSNISTTQIYAHNLDRLNNNCEETISKSIFK